MAHRPPATPTPEPNESTISLPPPLLHTRIIVEEEQVVDERTGLLKRTEHVKLVKEKRKASAIWILPATFVFALLTGAGTIVEVEIIGQMACRLVAGSDPTLEPPSSVLTGIVGSFLALPGSPASDWVLRCRADSAVQKRSTEIVTSIALLGGILSAVTSGYWGKVSDKYGRKPVLAVASLGELLAAAIFVSVLALPNLFGFKVLLFGAILGGLAGGQLTGMTVASAYLGDCAVDGSKTQLLSTLFGIYMAGIGVGPLFGSFLLRQFTSGVLLIYISQMLARIIYLAIIPIIPESLVPSLRTHSRPSSLFGGNDDHPSSKDESILVRIAKIPAELIKPFEVLLPKIKYGGGATSGRRTKDWRLLLIACSYTLAMVVPMAVKMLFVRGKFGWGPEETGQWITFLAMTRVVLLVLIVPFIVKYLRKPVPIPLEPRPEVDEDNVDSAQAALRWDAEAARLKKAADTGFDLSTARWSTVITVLGYLFTSIPSGESPKNFIIGTVMTSPGALTIPALQSIALAIAPPDDAGKVLACLSALATFTSSTIGPSLFGAIYMLSLDWWAELVFVVAALWTLSSLVPLLLVKVKSPRLVLEDHDD
ncbi:hypothetical protein JCM16303_006011 [Sporobolomyces ruberrimus]